MASRKPATAKSGSTHKLFKWRGSVILRLCCLAGILLLLVATIIAATLWVTRAQRADSLVMNLAGRQRMLTQRFSKEVLHEVNPLSSRGHLPVGGEPSRRLGRQRASQETATLFEMTAAALRYGGTTYSDPAMDQTVTVPATTNPRIRSKLAEVDDLWEQLRQAASGMRVAAGDASDNSTTYREQCDRFCRLNVACLKEMDAAVHMYQADAEAKVAMLTNIQYAAGAMAILAFAAFLRLVPDVTERERAEDALRESEELHRITLSSISDTVLIADDSGTFSFVCPNVHVIFGYSEDEVAAKNVRQFLGENLFDRDRLETAGELTNIERVVGDKSGRDHVLLITVKRVSIGRGTILYTCRDITDHKRAEDALAEERRLGELLLDSLPHAAMLIRRDRTIVAANKTAREVGGKIGGLCWREFGQADYIPQEDKQYLRQHGAPPPHGTRCTFCLADESLECRGPTNNPLVHSFGRIWDTHWVPLDDDIYLHYAIDMTDHIQTETELRQSEILRAEAEKLAAAGRMAARVAHEINNPLAGIKSAFQLIKKAVPKDHPRYDYVGQIEKEIHRIATIVRQMIGLHRAERETESAVSVRQVVQEVVSMLDPIHMNKGVSIEMEMEDCPDIVRLPENALRQVLYSLLINAIEASPTETVVRIQALAENGMLRIRIRDQGPGIPQDLRTRVFEPFFTTKNADTTGGLGLGLSIAKGIVEAAGGILEFKSQPNQGCVFEVVLPIGETDEQPDNGSCGSNLDCGR